MLGRIYIGQQRVEGEESKGVERPPRLRAKTHGGENDCSTVPGNSRKTFPRYLRDFRMHNINSSAALIFRAAMDNKYMVYTKHVWILQYFIVEYQ